MSKYPHAIQLLREEARVQGPTAEAADYLAAAEVLESSQAADVRIADAGWLESDPHLDLEMEEENDG